jgi:regulator of sirC expression with transglutaminase-like and TPR domain
LLQNWIHTPEKDLLKGTWIIAKYQFPDLEFEDIVTPIETIEKTIWLELNNKLTAYEKVKTINKVLFELHGFSGDTKHYTSPYNSYINSVLETRKGNPLSLSILYSVLAQRLGIPIYGVNLPNHFVLAYIDENNSLQEIENTQTSNGVFFYINAFSKGTLFSMQDIDLFLEKINIEKKKEFYEPCSNSAILTRMLNNLIVAYSETKKPEKVEELILLKNLFNP